MWERTLYCKPYAHWNLECVSQKTMDHSLQSDPWHSGRKHLLRVTGSNALVKPVMKTGQHMIPWVMMISGSGKPYIYENLCLVTMQFKVLLSTAQFYRLYHLHAPTDTLLPPQAIIYILPKSHVTPIMKIWLHILC